MKSSYHGDDGRKFKSSNTGERECILSFCVNNSLIPLLAYGPTFTTGDVIGLGLDTAKGTLFFTKNGEHLGRYFMLRMPSSINLQPKLMLILGLLY
jgi:hypothetical protein